MWTLSAVTSKVAKRSVPERLLGSSQTWRTFLANHLGDLAFTSTETSSYAPRDDNAVDEDAYVFSFRAAPPSPASDRSAVIEWPPSLQRTSLGWRIAQAHLHQRTRTRSSCGRDPPKAC